MVHKGSVILVTGGSRGIGAATVRLACDLGYDICFSYRENVHAANQVVEYVSQRGHRALPVQADLSCESDILALWRQAIEEFGSITGLVNNAGILEQQTPLAQFTVERLQRIMGINVIGTMLCTREAVRHMSTDHGGLGGSIVTVSSMAARFGSPNEYIDYAVSKGAVDTMTVGLAKEVAKQGIRVNSVRPGSIYTDIHASGGEPDRVDRIAKHVPLGRGGQPEEIAQTIMWLISDAASYTTGAIVDVSGGL